MTARDDPPHGKAWQLPLKWLQEEKFWRDIATRVLAGAITAAIVYAGALLLGYLHTPEIGAGVLMLLGVVGAAIFGAVGFTLLSGIPRRRREGRTYGGPLAAAVLALAVAALSLARVGYDLIVGR